MLAICRLCKINQLNALRIPIIPKTKRKTPALKIAPKSFWVVAIKINNAPPTVDINDNSFNMAIL